MFLKAVVEEKLQEAQKFLTMESWVPNTHAYMKKVFFSSHPKTTISDH